MGAKALTEAQIKRIIYLRRRGHSLPEIYRLTRHGYGTVFKYIRGVEILPQFRELWRSKRKSSIFRSLQEQRKAREQASELIGNINKKEKIIVAACLYWAEGSKGDLSLSNTDPDLIKTFIAGLKELGIGRERISLNLRLYEDLDEKRARRFWSKVVGVPESKIMYVDVLRGKKNGKLPYGMCRVRVIKGGYFLKLLHAIKDVIKDYTAPVVQ